MKLRFEVDQAAAFRQGVDVPKSIVMVEKDPAELPQEERDLIADRLDGIDVRQLWISISGPHKGPQKGTLIRATLPTYEALLEAIRANEKELAEQTRGANQNGGGVRI